MNTKINFFVTLYILSFITFNAGASITYTGSEAYGGNGGQSFILPEGMAYETISQITNISRISLKVSNRIEKIQVFWSQKNGGRPIIEGTGENGGTWRHIYLSRGEYITQVKGKTGRFVNQLTFYTNYGKKYGPYGGSEGNSFKIEVPTGYEVIGFFGNSGQCIDKIGLVYKVDEDKIGRDPRPGSRPSASDQPETRDRPRPRPRPGTITPRSSGTAQNNVNDHRKRTTGKKATPKKRTSKTVDHRKDPEKERREWLIKNGFDPDRAGG